MSKSGQELEKRLDANKYEMYEALRLIAESKAPENKYDKYDAMGYVKIAKRTLAKVEKG